MGKNIDEINQTVIVVIEIYSTYTFVRSSWIHQDLPVLFASMWYNTPKKGNNHIDNSISNSQYNKTARAQP